MLGSEEKIQRAIQEGKFDRLDGKGKPLHFEDDALADPDWRMAYHLLRQNGFCPPWLELRKQIESDLEQSLCALRAAFDWWNSNNGHEQDAAMLDPVYVQARQDFCRQIDCLNRRIFEYNLQTPCSRFQIRLLDPASEMASIQAEYS